MRVQLPILSSNGAGCDNAELPARQIERRTREHLAIAFLDHPLVEGGMQLRNVDAQALIKAPVHRGTGALTLRQPLRRIINGFGINRRC